VQSIKSVRRKPVAVIRTVLAVIGAVLAARLLGCAAQFGHFRLLRDQIEPMSAEPAEAMRPFVAVIDAFHARTALGLPD
jgi:tRNA-(MS[2]IO[6]A)-hydroxylase (MiaE)-like